MGAPGIERVAGYIAVGALGGQVGTKPTKVAVLFGASAVGARPRGSE